MSRDGTKHDWEGFGGQEGAAEVGLDRVWIAAGAEVASVEHVVWKGEDGGVGAEVLHQLDNAVWAIDGVSVNG